MLLRVLTYHRVADPTAAPDLYPELLSATPSAFAQQMAHLATCFRPVHLEDVTAAAAGGRALPPRAVLITFDHAYRDFADAAWPILQRWRLPVTVFVPTAYPDDPHRRFWWDRLHRAIAGTSRPALEGTPLGKLPLDTPERRKVALQHVVNLVRTMSHWDALALVDQICLALGDHAPAPPSVLGWEELRRLAREGVCLGAQTRTHPMLTQVSPAAAREEISGSLADLRQAADRVLPVLSYPFGALDDVVVELAREAGIELAFTTRDGHNDLREEDPLRLRRTTITRRTSALAFRLRLRRLATYVELWGSRARESG